MEQLHLLIIKQGGIYNFTDTGAIGLTTTGQQITTTGVGLQKLHNIHTTTRLVLTTRN